MTSQTKSDGKTIFDYIKYIYSTCLFLFCTTLVMGLIFAKQTKLAKDVHPIFAFGMIWCCLVWLNMVEGSQASFVGLPPVHKDFYESSHPITYRCCSLAHKNGNLDRYLTGRQFLVILIVFVTNLAGAPISKQQQQQQQDQDETAEATTNVFGLPDWLMDLFLGSGLAMILMTAMFGQLNSQVNASHCMLDYVNTYFALFTLWVSLIVEYTGVFHSCYAIQMWLAKISDKPILHHHQPSSSSPPTSHQRQHQQQEGEAGELEEGESTTTTTTGATSRTTTNTTKARVQQVFFWSRVVMSFAILAFGFAVTSQAIIKEKTTMWDGVPPKVSIFLFLFFLSIIGLLEGMQIAFFAVAKLPKHERTTANGGGGGEDNDDSTHMNNSNIIAEKTCHLLFKKGGRNLPGFMIGRQLCVTLCFFVVARVTTIDIDIEAGDEPIFGFTSKGMQAFLNTGLLAAILTTVIGSITWQLVASAFPIAFLSNPVVYVLLNLCLFLEATGVCSGAWVIAAIHSKVAGFQRDEVYIGTPEDRATQQKEDHSEFQQVEPGHPRLPVFRAGTNQMGNYTIEQNEHSEIGDEELQ